MPTTAGLLDSLVARHLSRFDSLAAWMCKCWTAWMPTTAGLLDSLVARQLSRLEHWAGSNLSSPGTATQLRWDLDTLVLP